MCLFLCLLGGLRGAGAGALEDALREHHLLPTATAPTTCSLPAFEVQGDHRQQRIVEIWRMSAHRKFSVMGERFHFTAENRGEFGGSFRMRRIGGTARELLPGNVLNLVPAGPRLFVFMGLAHMGVSQGAVYIVDDYDMAPKLRQVTLLPEAPDVFALQPGGHRFLLVSTLSVVLLSKGDSIEVITARHHVLPFANSALMLDTDIIVGLCDGVAVIHMPWRDQRPPAYEDEATTVRYWAERKVASNKIPANR